MHYRHQQKRPADPMQQRQVVALDRIVNPHLDQQGNADIGGGVKRHRQDGQYGIALVRRDVSHQPHHDFMVISGAGHGFVAQVISVGGAVAGGANAPHPPHHPAKAAPRPGHPHQARPPAASAAVIAESIVTSSINSSCGRNCNSKISR